MIVYYDQHLHTHHSFDSEEAIENYLAVTSNQLVTTEHLDFHNPAEDFKDSIPDFTRYQQEFTKVEETYQRPLLRGIEVGYVPSQKDIIKEFLVGKPYDVVLLSTHQDGEIDFMDPVVRTYDVKKLIEAYYTQMLQSIKDMPEANILTHFDYGVRQINITAEDYQKLAEPLLIEIFKAAIEANLAVELNAKSFVKYNNQHLYEYAIPLYISLGGKLFTLGSDAHVAEDYELGFEEMGALLKKHGVTQLVTFNKQEMTLVDF